MPNRLNISDLEKYVVYKPDIAAMKVSRNLPEDDPVYIETMTFLESIKRKTDYWWGIDTEKYNQYELALRKKYNYKYLINQINIGYYNGVITLSMTESVEAYGAIVKIESFKINVFFTVETGEIVSAVPDIGSALDMDIFEDRPFKPACKDIYSIAQFKNAIANEVKNIRQRKVSDFKKEISNMKKNHKADISEIDAFLGKYK